MLILWKMLQYPARNPAWDYLDLITSLRLETVPVVPPYRLLLYRALQCNVYECFLDVLLFRANDFICKMAINSAVKIYWHYTHCPQPEPDFLRRRSTLIKTEAFKKFTARARWKVRGSFCGSWQLQEIRSNFCCLIYHRLGMSGDSIYFAILLFIYLFIYYCWELGVELD